MKIIRFALSPVVDITYLSSKSLTFEVTAIEPHKYKKIKVFSDTSFVFQYQYGKQ